MKKILVVNNDIETMKLLQAWLERRHYKVKFTTDGDVVMKMVRDFEPDLVLIDILQSKIARALKENAATKYLPLLLMTGYSTTKDSKNNIQADDVIAKPFNLDMLKSKIEKLLNVVI